MSLIHLILIIFYIQVAEIRKFYLQIYNMKYFPNIKYGYI